MSTTDLLKQKWDLNNLIMAGFGDTPPANELWADAILSRKNQASSLNHLWSDSEGFDPQSNQNRGSLGIPENHIVLRMLQQAYLSAKDNDLLWMWEALPIFQNSNAVTSLQFLSKTLELYVDQLSGKSPDQGYMYTHPQHAINKTKYAEIVGEIFKKIGPEVLNHNEHPIKMEAHALLATAIVATPNEIIQRLLNASGIKYTGKTLKSLAQETLEKVISKDDAVKYASYIFNVLKKPENIPLQNSDPKRMDVFIMECMDNLNKGFSKGEVAAAMAKTTTNWNRLYNPFDRDRKADISPNI